jgi:hypothetical protein
LIENGAADPQPADTGPSRDLSTPEISPDCFVERTVFRNAIDASSDEKYDAGSQHAEHASLERFIREKWLTTSARAHPINGLGLLIGVPRAGRVVDRLGYSLAFCFGPAPPALAGINRLSRP